MQIFTVEFAVILYSSPPKVAIFISCPVELILQHPLSQHSIRPALCILCPLSTRPDMPPSLLLTAGQIKHLMFTCLFTNISWRSILRNDLKISINRYLYRLGNKFKCQDNFSADTVYVAFELLLHS